jgi:hypothetical protein
MTSPAFAFFRALAFMVAGFLALFVSFVGAVATAVFVSVASPAPGVVVDSPSGGFHPVVEFTTADGHVRREQLSTITWLGRGQEVTVLYVPDGWHGAEHDTVADVWLFPLLPGGMGVLFIGAGVVMLLDARPRRR